MKIPTIAIPLFAAVAIACAVGTGGCAERVRVTGAYITQHGQFAYNGSQQKLFEAAKRALVLEGYTIAIADAERFTIVTRPKLINVSSSGRSSSGVSVSDFSIRLTLKVIDGHSKVKVRITPSAFVGGVRQTDYEYEDMWLRRLLNTILRTIWDENKKGAVTSWRTAPGRRRRVLGSGRRRGGLPCRRGRPLGSG